MQRYEEASPAACALRMGVLKHRHLRRKPLPAPPDDRVNMLRPIVQHTRSNVRSVWPDKRAQILIDTDLPEQAQIPQGTKEGVGQDRRKVGGAFSKPCQSFSGQLEYCSSRMRRQTKA